MPDTPTPTTIVTTATDLQPILQVLSDATTVNWNSSDSIDSILTKGLAAVAVFHPGLNVQHWEPVIIGISFLVVILEQTIRSYRKTHNVTTALQTLQAALEADRVISPPATIPAPPAPTPEPVFTPTPAPTGMSLADSLANAKSVTPGHNPNAS